tara:strand:- start:2182 stop:2493 length:312 start_codon:yes stop_codon:yes gene_type:complete
MSKNFGIGRAVEYLKSGYKVQRPSWNGAGMWIVMMDELKLPPYSTQDTSRKVNDRTAKHIGEDTEFHSMPYIAMWNAQGKWQPGWVCNQSDLLATDWQLVKET